MFPPSRVGFCTSSGAWEQSKLVKKRKKTLLSESSDCVSFMLTNKPAFELFTESFFAVACSWSIFFLRYSALLSSVLNDLLWELVWMIDEQKNEWWGSYRSRSRLCRRPLAAKEAENSLTNRRWSRSQAGSNRYRTRLSFLWLVGRLLLTTKQTQRTSKSETKGDSRW